MFDCTIGRGAAGMGGCWVNFFFQSVRPVCEVCCFAAQKWGLRCIAAAERGPVEWFQRVLGGVCLPPNGFGWSVCHPTVLVPLSSPFRDTGRRHHSWISPLRRTLLRASTGILHVRLAGRVSCCIRMRDRWWSVACSIGRFGQSALRCVTAAVPIRYLSPGGGAFISRNRPANLTEQTP